MSNLKVDYEHLAELVQHLDAGLAAMGSEGDTSDQIADAAGDAQLAGKIRAFGSSWEFHRQHVQDTLSWLKTSIQNIHDALESVDQQLGTSLNSADGPSSASPKTA